MMTEHTRAYREANELEQAFYWEQTDKLSDLYKQAVEKKDQAAMVHFQYQKQATYNLFMAIGYRVDNTGIYMRNDPDILDTLIEEEALEQLKLTCADAMHAMRYGPKQ